MTKEIFLHYCLNYWSSTILTMNWASCSKGCTSETLKGHVNNIPIMQSSLEFLEILSQNHLCYHCLSVSGISKSMHCAILIQWMAHEMRNLFLFCINEKPEGIHEGTHYSYHLTQPSNIMRNYCTINFNSGVKNKSMW